MTWIFFLNSALLGVGLAMDAFSVSLANGLNEPDMSKRKALGVSAVFAFFQCAMPMIGWVCVHFILEKFKVFEKFVPWIALALLTVIGVKMILDGVKTKDDEVVKKLGFGAILVQGIATSIDALSVGFTIAEYEVIAAVVCCAIIAVITFGLCVGGVYIGKQFGTRLKSKASIFGGVILILIGIEIFVLGLLGI